MKKIVKHNQLECIFDSKNHSYKVGNEFLESVTTFKKKFFPEFNMEEQAALYSKRHNIPIQSVLKDWKQKGDVGRMRGLTLHSYAEKLLMDQPVEFKEHSIYEPILRKAISRLKSKFSVHGVEYIVFSLSLKLAGTLDAVLVSDDRVMLLDWKTDKKMQLANSWDRVYHPFSFLDACNFNEYVIQLNLYQFIMEKEGYFPPWVTFMKRIVHLIDGKAIWFKIPDLQGQVAGIFHQT